MSDSADSKKSQGKKDVRKPNRRSRERGRRFASENSSALEIDVGQSLRQLRKEQELTLSTLAEVSELNILMIAI